MVREETVMKTITVMIMTMIIIMMLVMFMMIITTIIMKTMTTTTMTNKMTFSESHQTLDVLNSRYEFLSSLIWT